MTSRVFFVNSEERDYFDTELDAHEIADRLRENLRQPDVAQFTCLTGAIWVFPVEVLRRTQFHVVPYDD